MKKLYAALLPKFFFKGGVTEPEGDGNGAADRQVVEAVNA
jgi:hypothetical protein